MLSLSAHGVKVAPASSRPLTAGGRAASRCPTPRARDVRVRTLEGNPLFTDQFMSVLRESMQRQGEDALTSNSKPAEPRISATEEVLGAALSYSKQSLAVMCQWRDQLDKQIAVQQKQVERLEFALNKTKSDAAYMNALKDLLHDS